MNDGNGHFNFVADGVPYGFSSGVSGDSSLYHDLTDFNGDKMLDMVTGQGENGNFDEKVYYGGGGSLPDTKAPLFRAIETPTPLAETPTVIRYALRDNVTNEAGQMIKATSITYSLAGGAPKTVKGVFYGADLFRATIPAQSAGAVVSVYLSATDRVGNSGSSPTFKFTVPTPVAPPVVSTGGSGGIDGTGGTTASGGSGGATAGSGGASAGTGGETAGAAGSGEAGAAEGGAGGEAGETSVAGTTSVGGSSTGTGGKSSGKAGSASSVGGEAGGPSSSAGTKGHYETADEGGCSVSTPTASTKGRGAAMLGFGLAMLGLVRRRRNSKQ
jgi:MYXO-CTERM domain-containing protein